MGLQTTKKFFSATSAQLGVTLNNPTGTGTDLFAITNLVQKIVGASGQTWRSITLRGVVDNNAGTGVTATFRPAVQPSGGGTVQAVACATALTITPPGATTYPFTFIFHNPNGQQTAAGLNNVTWGLQDNAGVATASGMRAATCVGLTPAYDVNLALGLTMNPGTTCFLTELNADVELF